MCKKKIISFSLWGANPKYVVGAIKNAELAKTIYSGWICRFYVGQSTVNEAGTYLKQLECFDNVEIIKMNEDGDWSGMFWRFLPISDDDVDVMISRDTDSRLSLREKCAVDEWLKSGKAFHIIRDHPYHDFKILGGMWGARKGVLGDMKLLIENFKKEDYWQVDQDFLAEIIFPRIKDNSFIHDEFGDGKRISKRRRNFEFIGNIYDEFDRQNQDFKTVLKEHLEYHKPDHGLLSNVKHLLKRLKINFL